jgi:hypothetical protein
MMPYELWAGPQVDGRLPIAQDCPRVDPGRAGAGSQASSAAAAIRTSESATCTMTPT